MMDFYHSYIVLTESQHDAFLATLSEYGLSEELNVFIPCDNGPVGRHFPGGYYLEKSDFDGFFADREDYNIEDLFTGYQSINFTFSNQAGGWA